jgi:chemotaxis signal transduction protein
MRPVIPVPRVPVDVCRVIALRGEIIQVVDLCRRLNLPAAEPTRRPRIIVLQVRDDLTAGLLVDGLGQVLHVAEGDMSPPLGAENGAVEALIKKGELFVSLLDLDVCSGLVDLRGVVIPIVDLGMVLAGVATVGFESARIAVVEAAGLVMGLIVDAAVEVLQVETLALVDPPALTTQAGYDAVRAVVRREEREPILVLSLDPILESIYHSALVASKVA